MSTSPTLLIPSASNYSKLDHRTHIYKIPDTYIGSCLKTEQSGDLYDIETKVMKNGTFDVPPGMRRLWMEVLSNAGDNAIRSRYAGISPGSIIVQMDETTMVIQNEGLPIPTDIHPEENIYTPYMIFGHLLTSSNFNTEVERLGCGRNGYGAKLCNIFSKYFKLEIGNSLSKKSYIQEWSNNMLDVTEPEVEDYEGESFTRITFTLDFERFGYEKYPKEAFELIARDLVNCSMTCKVPIIFNQTEINYQDLISYSKLYLPMYSKGESEVRHLFYEEKTRDDKPFIELCALDTPDCGRFIAFVNGIYTIDGGVHVEATYKILSKHILGTIYERNSKNKKDVPRVLNLKDIKNHVTLILNYHLPNPEFANQTKNRLDKPEPKFDIPENIWQQMFSWDLIHRLYAAIDAKNFNQLRKTDGKFRRHLGSDVPGRDANLAGTKESSECTLCVVEGKSASKYADSFVSNISNGRDYYGVIPFRGKPPNVMNIEDLNKLYENREYSTLKKMLGLTEKMDYTIEENVATLRYGTLMILADSDDDGKHIVGLILNMIYCQFPSLLQIGYVKFQRTPIIRVYKGKESHNFYLQNEYLKWYSNVSDPKKWKVEYYKGLGSSSDAEIEDDFKHPHYVLCVFDDTATESLKLAFDPKFVSKRKEWLCRWNEHLKSDEIKMIGYSEINRSDSVTNENLAITNFINREFIDYPMKNLHRSIPCLIDGFKESQRKVLWAAISLNIVGKTNLEAAANKIKAESNYHHGGQCLSDTITKMAQKFVGTNNLPYFRDIGQFGSREQGPDDAAAARYISIALSWWIPYVYRKEDSHLLNYHIDEGKQVEPITFLPIIPMGLINGFNGIATGHSTYGPNHSPLAVINWIRAKLNNEPLPKFKPWYRGFYGTIDVVEKKKKVIRDPNEKLIPVDLEAQTFMGDEKVGDEPDEDIPIEEPKYTMVTVGKYHFENDGKTLVVTELPVGRWTSRYHKWLEILIENRKIKDFKDRSTKERVRFEITGFQRPSHVTLQLIRSYGMTNMVLLTPEIHPSPKRYTSTTEILEDYFEYRFPFYEKRKNYLIQSLKQELQTYFDKINIVIAFKEKRLNLDQSDEDIQAQAAEQKLNYDLIDSIRLGQLKKTSVEKLQLLIEKCESKINELNLISGKELWLSDLDEFEKEYRKHYKDYEM